jgi:uncharacterized protein YbjT (DUF2867 family)
MVSRTFGYIKTKKMNYISKKPTTLIVGATGTIGSALAADLSALHINFKAMVRSPEKAGALLRLPGLELVVADLDDPDSLDKALRGIHKVFLVTNSSEQAEAQQLTLVDAAVKAGVHHIVKLSQFAADLNSPVRFLRYHAVVEEKIKASGIAYTFLRPNLFMQGLLAFRHLIAQESQFFAPAGQAKVSLIDIRDIAAVAAKTLIEAGHEGMIYDLTGPDAITHSDIAASLSDAAGHPIRYVDVEPAAMRKALLSAGFPEWQADGLLEDYAHYARGEAQNISTAVKQLAGRPAIHFKDFAQEHAALFIAPTAL